MSIETLPADLQILELYNFEMFIRLFWIFLMVAVSVIYVFYWRPNHEEKTPFLSIATVRGVLYIFSIILLICTPLLFLGMSPQGSAWVWILPFFSLYAIMLGIYVMTLFIDLIQFGIPVLLKIGGIDMDDPKVAQIYRRFFGKKNG